VLRLQGKHAEAEAQQRAALRIVRPAVDAGSPLLGYLLLELGRAQEGQGKIGEATTTLEEAQAQLHASLPARHPRQVEARMALAAVWHARDRPDKAAPLLREAERLAAQVYGDDHWRTAHARSDLGACLHRLGEAARARTLLATAHATLAAARGPGDALAREAHARLAALPAAN
jgi:Flp pilus assembly protein TadD